MMMARHRSAPLCMDPISPPPMHQPIHKRHAAQTHAQNAVQQHPTHKCHWSPSDAHTRFGMMPCSTAHGPRCTLCPQVVLDKHGEGVPQRGRRLTRCLPRLRPLTAANGGPFNPHTHAPLTLGLMLTKVGFCGTVPEDSRTFRSPPPPPSPHWYPKKGSALRREFKSSLKLQKVPHRFRPSPSLGFQLQMTPPPYPPPLQQTPWPRATPCPSCRQL